MYRKVFYYRGKNSIFTVRQTKGESDMRRFIAPGGVVYAQLNKPEDKKLFSEISTLVQNDLAADISSSDFLVFLMKHYAETRKHRSVTSRPML
jgi:hypothetical protein